MEKLFKRHYEAIANRGLITKAVKIGDFLDKLDEESTECFEYYNLKNMNDELAQELVDVICTAANTLKHFNYDLKIELEKNVIHQETRND